MYLQILYRYGCRFTSDSEIIKDCIQDLFTVLYKNRKTLVVPDNVKVYLMVSLKNNLIRALYKENFYNRNDTEGIEFSLEPTVEDVFIDNEQVTNQQKEIQKIFALLTSRQKEVLYYRYIQELEIDKICLLMNMNYQSVENLIQRSLKKIRTSYGYEAGLLFLLLPSP
ncbi:MAG: sigma-70 family RNA polymerase sigma factor [Tannerellaceae bacterium]